MVETILVTGGAGFIGTNFIRYTLRTRPGRYRIINLDSLTYAGRRDNLEDLETREDYRFVHGSICDEKVVESLLASGVDYVVNFAAETHVDRSIIEAGDFIQTDVHGVYVLLKSTLKYPVRRFIHISTDEVYGEAEGKASEETDPLNPKSPYAASKAGGDRLAWAFQQTYGCPVVITRCVNNFGPYQYPEKMIPLFITNVLSGLKMPVYGDGKNTREWIHAEDHSDAILFLMEYPDETVHGEVYNIGVGTEKSVLEIVDMIRKQLGEDAVIEHVPDRPGHVTRHAVNSNRIRALGWRPDRTDFESEFAATVEWYRDNRSWWEEIRLRDEGFREYYDKQYRKREK